MSWCHLPCSGLTKNIFKLHTTNDALQWFCAPCAAPHRACPLAPRVNKLEGQIIDLLAAHTSSSAAPAPRPPPPTPPPPVVDLSAINDDLARQRRDLLDLQRAIADHGDSLTNLLGEIPTWHASILKDVTADLSRHRSLVLVNIPEPPLRNTGVRKRHLQEETLRVLKVSAGRGVIPVSMRRVGTWKPDSAARPVLVSFASEADRDAVLCGAPRLRHTPLHRVGIHPDRPRPKVGMAPRSTIPRVLLQRLTAPPKNGSVPLDSQTEGPQEKN